MRSEPSRSASIAGARKTGDEVIVDEVTEDGWVRVSRELDAYVGYEHWNENQGEFWMLTRAEDVGQLMCEVAVDERGEEIDDDEWMPDMV